MSFLKKVEVVALKKNRLKGPGKKSKVKSKPSKAADEKNTVSSLASKRKHKKAVNAFFKYLDSFVGQDLDAKEFVNAMKDAWKTSERKKSKTFAEVEVPDLLKFMRKVLNEAKKS